MKRLLALAVFLALAGCTRERIVYRDNPVAPTTPAVEATPKACEMPSDWSNNYPPTVHPTVLKDVIEAAKVAVGERCGLDWHETLRLVADWLNARGYCARAGEEAVFVYEPGTRYAEEWHLVYSANGCWTGSKAYKGVHF